LSSSKSPEDAQFAANMLLHEGNSGPTEFNEKLWSRFPWLNSENAQKFQVLELVQGMGAIISIACKFERTTTCTSINS